MHYIKKKYSFTAEKEMNKEDSGGKLNKYQTVLYCEHCHKMDWLYKYLVVDCGDGQVKNITEDMVDFSQLTRSEEHTSELQSLRGIADAGVWV